MSADRRRPLPRRPAVMRAEHVTKEFGGLVAVNDVSLDHPAAVDRVADRSQRRRQDDALQHAHRAVQADHGQDRCSARATSPGRGPT